MNTKKLRAAISAMVKAELALEMKYHDLTITETTRDKHLEKLKDALCDCEIELRDQLIKIDRALERAKKSAKKASTLS